MRLSLTAPLLTHLLCSALLAHGQSFVPFTPTVGTALLPEPPLEAWAAGRARDIPIIAGTVQQEGVLFVYSAFAKPVSKTAYDLVCSVHDIVAFIVRLQVLTEALCAWAQLLPLLFGITDGLAVESRFPPANATDARMEGSLVQ